jgi:hypothetical protein
MGNYHVRFCNGGGAGDRSTDRSEADAASRPCVGARFIVVGGLVLGVGCAKSRRGLCASR